MQAHLGLRSNYFRVFQVTLDRTPGLRPGHAVHLTGRVWPRPSSRRQLPAPHRILDTLRAVSVARLALDSQGRFVLHLTPRADKAYRLALRTGAFSPVIHVTVVP